MLLSFITCLLLTLSAGGVDQPAPVLSSADEELIYEVSWAHIKLGTLRISLEHHRGDSGSATARAVIDSYPKSRLVDMHLIACSEIDSAGNAVLSYSYEKDGNQWEAMLYQYDPERGCVLATKVIQDNAQQIPKASKKPDLIPVRRFPVQDGISLIYAMRSIVRQTGSSTVPTVSMGKVGETDFYTKRVRTTIEIDSCPYPVRVLKLSGKLRLEGVFGLKGDFEGWFTDDDESVPVVAKMKVLLGSIRIELKQWNRKHEYHLPGDAASRR
jgi:hypothetical protein